MGLHVFVTKGNIYSVDMMIAYINIFKPKSKCVHISAFFPLLESKVWKDRERNKNYAPIEVISDPRKYPTQINRINDANLDYPIIVEKTRNNTYPIIDGVHRITKAYISGKKKIKIYELTTAELKKFIIGKTNNWKKIDDIKRFEDIKMFYDRFCR